MRIAVVLDRYDPGYGGLEGWSHRWTCWLAGKGHEVHVAAFDAAASAAPAGVRVHILPGVSGRLARAAEAERLLRRLGPDIIHDLGLGWHYDILQPQAGSRLANLAGDLLSLGAWSRFKAALSPGAARRRAEFRALEIRQFAPGGGLVIAVSRRVRDELERRYRLNPERVRLVYNGIDLRRLEDPDPRACRDSIRRSLGLGGQALFLFAGHNYRLKGLGPAIRSLARLGRTGRSCHLAVIGRGRVEDYRTLARRLGVQAGLSFLGFVPDERPYFLAAEAFLQPTFYDACSLAVVEAWACGLPVITTRFNGAAELMKSGVQGWVLDDPRDIPTLAGRLESLLDPGLRYRMSEAARVLGAAQSEERNFSLVEGIIRERT
jgi:UDP-glucose:(heptosyl)LPS alpha-1,3-glucosyltransferase